VAFFFENCRCFFVFSTYSTRSLFPNPKKVSTNTESQYKYMKRAHRRYMLQGMAFARPEQESERM
jgi:hypothetical protein